MQPVLAVDGFTLRRSGGFAASLPALELRRGETAALFAPSGAGKSSVLQAMFGVAVGAGDRCSGQVRVLGRDFAGLSAVDRCQLLRGNVAWLLQDSQQALDPLQPVGEQIRQATYRSYSDCTATLRDLGVDDAEQLARRYPHQISGGQAQRVVFAVAALRQPELVVADEPTASLDDRTFEIVSRRLQQLRDQGAAVLLSTHDHRLVRVLGARPLVCRDGAFVPGEVELRPWPQRAPDAGAGEVPVLRARGVRARYGDRVVLSGVDLDLHRGEVVVVVGGSGQGKTTLARLLAGHREPDGGTIERPLRRGAVQMLCQDAAASLTPGRTLRSLVLEARAPYFDLEGTLAGLSLPVGILGRTAAQMSGGEQRRAALLRALAVHPDVLILDEPTTSLDRDAAVQVVETLMLLRQQRGVALLVVTHDTELANAIGNRIVRLQGGRT